MGCGGGMPESILFNMSFISFHEFHLKEQYPVSAHAPNFDFWTGCPEIKGCEESKRTLKNPFASRLAEFNTTLKRLRMRTRIIKAQAILTLLDSFQELHLEIWLA